jgi:hypothetical protein
MRMLAIACLGGLGLAAAATEASAQDPGVGLVAPTLAPILAAPPVQTGRADGAPAIPGLPAEAAARPITDAELAGLSGREGSSTTVLSDQDLTAVNRGNTITATTVGSGPITLGAGVFEGFAGVGNFVINSGHNNNLQGALTINIVAPQ